MSEPAFKGTLLLLQNRTRRDPESYKDEFLAQLEHFKASSATVAAQRVANPQYVAVLHFICHVIHCFPKESPIVAKIVFELLKSSKGNAFPAELRNALVKAMMLLRAKDLVSTEETFPILFMLLQERDKAMRKLILTHLVSDIRKVNMPTAKNGAQVNKRAQNFLFGVMAEDDPVQARCAEMVMIDLYRRRVWADERTVEVMTKACFSKHAPILRMALRFFLMQMPKISSVDDDKDDDDDEDQDPGRAISKLKQKLKIVKKTSYRNRVLERSMKGIKRKYNKSEKEEEELMKQHVDPIRLLRDPQQFVERLLAKLQKTSERFETRILYLNVIARTVSEHEIVHLPLYGFLERYMEPSQLHATQLLALSAMCVHRMVPPDAVEPLVKTIANHFVSDRSSPDAMTVGINTIREICKRQPLAMNEDLLKDLAEYKNQRGDKGVIMAARALIQLYRDVYPDLLPAKLRGSKAGAPGEMEKPVYGAEEVFTDIPGLSLLYEAAAQGDEESLQTGSRSTSSSDSDSSDDDSSSGEWVTDSDSEIAPDDVDGDFVDVTESDSDADDADDVDACPQLVPVAAGASAGAKRTVRGADDGDSGPEAKRTRDEETSFVLSDGRPSTGKGTSNAVADEEEEESDSSEEEEEEEEEEEGEESEAEATSAKRTELRARGGAKGAPVSADELGSDEDEDDEEDSSSGSWEEAGSESTDDDDEEEEEGEWQQVSDDSEAEEEGGDLAKALTSYSANKDWQEDCVGRSEESSETSTKRASSQTSSKLSNASMSSSRILTDEDFQKIRKLQIQKGSHQSLRGKLKDREARSKRRNDLVHGISDDLSAHDIEHFTEKKRESDKQEKIERAQELRKASSKFEIRKKKKSKLNSTHGEHSKRGKLFNMTKRSHRVAAKLKSSVSDRASRAKEMKKKDIKFRIKRGWKA